MRHQMDSSFGAQGWPPNARIPMPRRKFSRPTTENGALMLSRARPRSEARAILAWPLAFALIGLLWVTVTDSLLAITVDSPHLLWRLQTYKEWFFVILASALTGWMLARLRIRLQSRLVRLEAILDGTPNALCVIREGQVVLANPAFRRLFGYEREREILGLSIGDFFGDGANGSLLSASFSAALPGGHESLRVNGRNKAGQLFPVAIDLAPLALGNERYIVATIRALEADPASSDDAEPDPGALMRAIVDGMPQPLLACDRRGRWIVHNRQARRLLALPEEALPTDQLPVFLYACYADGSPLAPKQLPTARAMSSGAPQFSRLQIGARPSDLREVTANAYPLLREGGGENLGAAMIIAPTAWPMAMPQASTGLEQLYAQAVLANELETCCASLVDWLTAACDSWMALNILDPKAGCGVLYERRAFGSAPLLCCHRYETKRTTASTSPLRAEICDLDHLPASERAPALRNLLAAAGIDSYLRIPLLSGTPAITLLISCTGTNVVDRLKERLPEPARPIIGRRLAELWQQRRCAEDDQRSASIDALASDRFSTS